MSKNWGGMAMKLPRRQMRALLQQHHLTKPTPKGLSWSTIAGVIGFITSFVAFGFSAVAFFNSIEQVDDIRVVSSDLPTFVPYLPWVATVYSHGDWIITNAGNRSAAITGATIILSTAPEESGDAECSERTFLSGVSYNLEPFVLEPKHVVIKHMRMVDFSPHFEDGNTTQHDEYEKRLRLADVFDRTKELKVKACVVVSIVTPDEKIRAARVVYSAIWKPHESAIEDKRESFRGKPWVLINTKRSTFLNWGAVESKAVE